MPQYYQLLGITRRLKDSELFTGSKVRAGTLRGKCTWSPSKREKGCELNLKDEAEIRVSLLVKLNENGKRWLPQLFS